MISIELILPEKGKRLCMRVGETTSVGELKRYLRSSFKVKNESIFILSPKESITDDMTLKEAGMYTGSGVLITNG